ncbi:hypothetical protein LSAT2_005401 [Lamellibrachia satsuma]|nr:hypothetical protein LSAT2_005401 [Lamellibrachia satsuma]
MRTRQCSGDICDEGSNMELGPSCNSNPCSGRSVTCSELKKAGLSQTSDVQVYPDFSTPVWVHCNMDDDDGVGITVIGHDNLERIDATGREFADGLDIELTYNVSIKTINDITDQSLNCRQHIKWQCRSAPISDVNNPTSPLRLLDKQGQRKTFILGRGEG